MVYSVHPDSSFPGIQGLQPLAHGRIHSNIFMASKDLINGAFAIPNEEVSLYWRELLASFDVGMSSGANLAAVIKLIEKEGIKKGTIVTVFPDHSDRYESLLIKK